MKILNATIAQLKSKSDSPKGSDSSSIAEDVTLLKKGMADTGGEIKKLTDDNAEAKKTIRLLTKIIKGMKQKYVNLTVSKLSYNSKYIYIYLYLIKVVKLCTCEVMMIAIFPNCVNL